MGQPAAKQGDRIQAVDIHMILTPSGAVIPVPHIFSGIITGDLSSNVNIGGFPAATLSSTATNTPPHIPLGGSFTNPPSNQGQIMLGSTSVFINNKPAARNGDSAKTCNDPVDLLVGTVIAMGTVVIGG